MHACLHAKKFHYHSNIQHASKSQASNSAGVPAIADTPTSCRSSPTSLEYASMNTESNRALGDIMFTQRGSVHASQPQQSLSDNQFTGKTGDSLASGKAAVRLFKRECSCKHAARLRVETEQLQPGQAVITAHLPPSSINYVQGPLCNDILKLLGGLGAGVGSKGCNPGLQISLGISLDNVSLQLTIGVCTIWDLIY